MPVTDRLPRVLFAPPAFFGLPARVRRPPRPRSGSSGSDNISGLVREHFERTGMTECDDL
jgi:hypothetical protein